MSHFTKGVSDENGFNIILNIEGVYKNDNGENNTLSPHYSNRKQTTCRCIRRRNNRQLIYFQRKRYSNIDAYISIIDNKVIKYSMILYMI